MEGLLDIWNVALNVALNVAYKPTERQQIILRIIKNEDTDNVALNTKYLSDKIGVSRKTIERELSILQKIKLIVWVGSKKYGHWEIVNNLGD